jgi:hypothetical protein
MAMMARPMRVRNGAGKEDAALAEHGEGADRDDGAGHDGANSAGVHVETGGKAQSGDHVLEQRHPIPAMPANDQVFSSCSPTTMMGPVARASPR